MSKKTSTTKIPNRYLDAEEDKKDLYGKIVKMFGNDDKAQVSLESLQSKVKSSKKLEEIINDAVTLFPDIELSMEILTTLIESPNDMQFPNLVYRMENVDLPTRIIVKILDNVKEHVNTEYKFVEKISDIIKDTLFYKGAYVEAILPGNDLVSLVQKLKQSEVKPSMEDMYQDTDFDLIPKSKILDHNLKDKNVKFSSTPLAICQEDFNEIVYKNKLEQKLYNNSNKFSVDSVVSMEDIILEDNAAMFVSDELVSGGKPFVKKLDPASIIPVTSSSDPSKHLGYFLILNDKGQPAGSSNLTQHISSAGGEKLAQIDDMLNGIKNKLSVMTSRGEKIKNIDDFRNKYLVEKLNKYLKMTNIDSLAPYSIDIPDDVIVDSIFNLFNKSKLNIIFLPAEMVSYTAIEYREDGTGKTLLEKVLMLLSIRGIAMFTRILSYIKASVTTTNVDVTLEDDDDNFRQTMALIKSSVIKNRQVALPIGEINPIKLTDWVHNLGFSFNFKHKNLPEMEVSVNEQAFDINPPDTSLEEDLDRKIYNAFYLTPEIVNDAMGPDFATTVVANRLLLSKRITKLQTKFDANFTDNIKKRLILDNSFKSKLYKILLEDKQYIKSYFKKKTSDPEKKKRISKATDDELFNWIIFLAIKNLKVALPKPESSELEYSSDSVDKFTSLLDSVMDRIFSSDALPDDLVAQLGDKISSASGAVKTMLLLRFINEKGIFPELSKLFTLDEEGEPVFNVLEEFNTYTHTLTTVLAPFIKSNKELQNEINKTLDKAENSGSDNDDDNSDNSDDGNSDDTDNNNSDNSTDDNSSGDNDNSDSGGNSNSDNSSNDTNTDDTSETDNGNSGTGDSDNNGGDADKALKSLM